MANQEIACQSFIFFRVAPMLKLTETETVERMSREEKEKCSLAAF